jgi:hypothetical protein
VWWLFPLIGLLVGLPCTYRWGGIGAIITLVLGIIVGEGIAFGFHSDPPQIDPYALWPSFRAIVGLLWAFLWSLGGFLGCVTGYVLHHSLRRFQECVLKPDLTHRNSQTDT